jgi:predicted RNase H-like nuclease (RuvC/YqgF family)
MWKRFVEFSQKLISLMHRVRKLEEDNRELQQELKELNQKIERLTDIVQRLAYEFKSDRDNAASERRILLLEIENRFLRFERGLPPGDGRDDGHI